MPSAVPSRAVDAVLLDLGNVLAFHDNERLFAELARAFRATRGELAAVLDAGLWDRINRGLVPGDCLRRELVARLGVEVGPEEWFSLWNCHFTINAPMVRAVERLVDQLPLVLLSNTHDQHVAWLWPRLPVLARFAGLVLSYEVGAVKPEAAIYRRAAEVAQVEPGRAVFFDDVPRYAEAAAASGLLGRVFTTVARFEADLADLGVAA